MARPSSEPMSESPLQSAESAPRPQRRALLVDDEPVIRFALRRFFQRQGWMVDEAENGFAALARLLPADANGPVTEYDVIISDLRMPGLSGIELYDRLEQERPDILRRLILSSGDTVSLESAAFLRRSVCRVLS